MSHFQIKMCEPSDVERFAKHFVDVIVQPGFAGKPIEPVLNARDFKVEEIIPRMQDRLKMPPFSLGWRVYWMVVQDEKVVGNLMLRFSDNPNDLHRAVIGCNIDHNYRHQGIGTALWKTCLEWTAMQPQVAWLDAQTVEYNLPLIKLAQKFGFTQTSHLKDAFRINGESVGLISFTKKMN